MVQHLPLIYAALVTVMLRRDVAGGGWTIELHDFIELLLSDGGVMGEVRSWQQLWI